MHKHIIHVYIVYYFIFIKKVKWEHNVRLQPCVDSYRTVIGVRLRSNPKGRCSTPLPRRPIGVRNTADRGSVGWAVLAAVFETLVWGRLRAGVFRLMLQI